jgi:hypothetical protein
MNQRATAVAVYYRRSFLIFPLAQLWLLRKIESIYEKLRQNSLLDSHGDDLRNCVCRRSARVQEDRKELPHE